MLIGELSHQLDEKKRIRIPAKFKTELGEGFIFCKGVNPCIYVMPKNAFEKMMNDFNRISFFDVEGQSALSEFTGSFYEAEEDAHGRIVLPQALREYAHIEKNVVTVGVFNRLEIWSEELRNERRQGKSFESQMKVLAERTK